MLTRGAGVGEGEEGEVGSEHQPSPAKLHRLWVESPEINPHRKPLVPKALCPSTSVSDTTSDKVKFSDDWLF